MINYGDICKIDGRAVQKVDCVIGGSPCFPADIPVLTLHGYKPIQDIVVGDLVLTHEGRYREVLNTGSHVDSLVRLSDGVHEILCTENHPFRSMDSDYKIDWTPARDMVGLSWLYLEDGPGYPCEWIKVLLCEKTDIRCEVFNLEVDEDNSYVANHLVVHNCQNLSIAGNKQGLEGNESRLFLEQIRLIREMRQASGFTKPRYMVWENVCHALSCNNGKDFQRVLDECVKTAIFGKVKEDINGKDKEYEKQPPQSLMCLCLKMENGQNPECCTMTWEDGVLLGEYMTHNTGESPNVVVESRLSSILEECPPQKYYLSPKACNGILTRATRRGKELPKPLMEALKNQITSGTQEGMEAEISAQPSQEITTIE